MTYTRYLNILRRKIEAASAIIDILLVAIDYTLTYLYATNSITRLILEGIFFLTVYTISLKLFRIVEKGDLELLKKALPHQTMENPEPDRKLHRLWNDANRPRRSNCRKVRRCGKRYSVDGEEN